MMTHKPQRMGIGTGLGLIATLAVSVLAISSLSHAQDKVSVTLPTSTQLFPAGEGADIANAYCLTCHSNEMVLIQPTHDKAVWQSIIEKMRAAYGAPVPAEQVELLARYFSQLRSLDPSSAQSHLPDLSKK